MSSPIGATLEAVGQRCGILVPLEIGKFKDTTCPYSTILVYDFDEIVKIVYRREGRGGTLPKSFDCLKFSSDGKLISFIEMKRFRELKERYLAKHPREQHLPLIDHQFQKYSTDIPGKLAGTLEAFELLQKQLEIALDGTEKKQFIVLTDSSWSQKMNPEDLFLYTLNYLADESTPLDFYVQMKMSGMIDDSFTGDEKPILVSCSTLEKHVGS